MDANDTEQLAERLNALEEYASDIQDLEVRVKAFKDLRDVIIVGLAQSGVPSRTIAKAAGVSHVRVITIAANSTAA